MKTRSNKLPNYKAQRMEKGETENRAVKAYVRPIGAQGVFQKKIFSVTIPVTGSFHAMQNHCIVAINQTGYEVERIIDTASRIDLL